MAALNEKVILVTGSTSGIGLESAVALAQTGATVVMVGRDPARSEAALAEVKRRSGSAKVELLLADLSSLFAVKKLADDFKARHQRLDVLLNNAGAVNTSRRTSPDGFELTFAVNHLAYFLLTRELLPLLQASAPARIVSVASDAHKGMTLDFGDLLSERSYSAISVYGKSKLANILFTRELSRRLAGTGVTANCLHPGVVATGFGKNNPGLLSVLVKLAKPFLLTAEKGARTSVHLAASPEVEGVTGEYFKNSKPIAPSKAAQDDVAAKKLWEVSEQLITQALAAKAA